MKKLISLFAALTTIFMLFAAQSAVAENIESGASEAVQNLSQTPEVEMVVFANRMNSTRRFASSMEITLEALRDESQISATPKPELQIEL